MEKRETKLPTKHKANIQVCLPKDEAKALLNMLYEKALVMELDAQKFQKDISDIQRKLGLPYKRQEKWEQP